MKKRFTAVILALLLSLSMIPSGALAAEEGIEAQNLEIPREGLTITEEMGNAVYTAGSGTITWDAASKTLTLDNATIGELNKRPDFGIKFKGTTPTDYTIKLVGSNVIDYSIEGICLFNHNSTLTIQGDGTLHIDNLSTTDGWTTYGIGTYFFDRNTNKRS